MKSIKIFKDIGVVSFVMIRYFDSKWWTVISGTLKLLRARKLAMDEGQAQGCNESSIRKCNQLTCSHPWRKMATRLSII